MRSAVPSPWVALAARADLLMVRADIPEPARYYDEHRAIVIRRGLLIVEERRYLWHELVHADRRDRACHGSPAVEQSVEREAVRRALPWSSIEWAGAQAETRDEMADMLKVPEEWLAFRMRTLHPAERAAWRVVSEGAGRVVTC